MYVVRHFLWGRSFGLQISWLVYFPPPMYLSWRTGAIDGGFIQPAPKITDMFGVQSDADGGGDDDDDVARD